MYDLEAVLRKTGFTYVAGCDEAGRGACAGPLVVAAAILPPGKAGRIEGLTDSKLLNPVVREAIFEEVVSTAVAHAVVVIPAVEVDTRGVGFCNLSGMRRAAALLDPAPDYVLTDGFAVRGLPAPGLGVIKGDQVSAAVAAASVLAKVTRDRIMTEMHERFPEYGFAEHKGYSTPMHQEALTRHGPCREHRQSYANVLAADRERGPGVASALEALAGAHDG